MLVPNTFVAALALLAAPVAGLSSAAISRFQATDLGTHRNASVPKLVHAAAITGGLLWTVYDDESLPMLNVTEAEAATRPLSAAAAATTSSATTPTIAPTPPSAASWCPTLPSPRGELGGQCVHGAVHDGRGVAVPRTGAVSAGRTA